MSIWQYGDDAPHEREVTEHQCPECGQVLTRILPSTMLVCEQEHGPYWIT